MLIVLFAAFSILFFSFLVFWPFAVKIANEKEYKWMYVSSLAIVLISRAVVILSDVLVFLKAPEGSSHSTVKTTLLIMICSAVTLLFSHIVIRKEKSIADTNFILSITAGVLVWTDFIIYRITG